MSTPTVVFHVSGHGFGHARRSAKVIGALRRIRPGLSVHVRTAAPHHIFRQVGLDDASIGHTELDCGVVERDALTVDPQATLERLRLFMSRRDGLVHQEVASISPLAPGLLVSDVPFLSGDVAQRLGVPCLAIGNFTWDWVYEAYTTGDLPRQVRESYGKMAAMLRLPLSHSMEVFAHVVDVPHIAAASIRPRGEVLAQLGIAPDDQRQRVLVAMRGGMATEVLFRAACESPEMLFLWPGPLAGDLPVNCRCYCLGPGLDAADAFAVSDVVISKLGYGTISECAANGAALLWPTRTGFREDEVFRASIDRELRNLELPAGDFLCGRWRAHLLALLEQPRPNGQGGFSGAEVCAGHILRWLGAGRSST